MIPSLADQYKGQDHQRKAAKGISQEDLVSNCQLVNGKVLQITTQNAIIQIFLIEGLDPLEDAIRMEAIRVVASEQLSMDDWCSFHAMHMR